MYVLHKAFGNFVLPSKGQQDAEEFEGGAVFDPITGVRENVSVLDLKSLYPMSMVTINASPETKVDPEEFDGDTYRTPTGVHFRKEPDGIIREMVDELLTEREEKKARRDDHEPDSEDYERYDRQQAAVKVIMNSLYGVFGWDRFRLYDRAMSAGVTSTNREVIDFTEQAAEEFGYEVAYGDTDSVMLELGDDMTKAEAIAESFDIEDHINAAYDEFAREQLHADDHRFQIEFEKLYRRFFQAGKKKRYAGHIVWKEGKDVDDVDITGFEYQRSDIAPITKRVQKEVIDLVVREGDVDAVEEYVHGVIEEFQEGMRIWTTSASRAASANDWTTTRRTPPRCVVRSTPTCCWARTSTAGPSPSGSTSRKCIRTSGVTSKTNRASTRARATLPRVPPGS